MGLFAKAPLASDTDGAARWRPKTALKLKPEKGRKQAAAKAWTISSMEPNGSRWPFMELNWPGE